jgi:lipoate-protein ligase A
MSEIRLLPYESADGVTNMAADETLLESAASGVASLRFYTWNPPTLSLGYFQPESVRCEPLLKDLPFVRRASGGATLVHHHELTYALALPAGLPWQRRGESWICRMHQVIGKALQSFEVPIEAGLCGAEWKFGAVLCFQHHTPGDLILKGHKIAGSAQRKQRGHLLQHGGLLLAQSCHTPNLPGLKELAGLETSIADLSTAIIGEFHSDTGWKVRPGEWTLDESHRTRELAESKYCSDEWNLKR